MLYGGNSLSNMLPISGPKLPLSIRNLINRHISQLTLLQIGTEVIAMSGYQCTALVHLSGFLPGSVVQSPRRGVYHFTAVLLFELIESKDGEMDRFLLSLASDSWD